MELKRSDKKLDKALSKKWFGRQKHETATNIRMEELNSKSKINRTGVIANVNALGSDLEDENNIGTVDKQIESTLTVEPTTTGNIVTLIFVNTIIPTVADSVIVFHNFSHPAF